MSAVQSRVPVSTGGPPPLKTNKPKGRAPKALAPPPAEPAPAPVPPNQASPSDQLAETVEEHALILARSQATLGEIIASVAESFALPLKEAADQVEAIKLSLLVAAHSGRAFLRRRIYDAATGRIAISRDERNLIMVLGRQHLGHTTAGTDAKVRRIVEAAERRALNVAMDGDEDAPDEPPPTLDGQDSI